MREAGPPSKPMNTSFSYLYRDADNYKASETIVIDGLFTPEEITLIESKLDQGLWFIPSEVGLEDIQWKLMSYTGDEPTDADHVWHELDVTGFEETDAEPTAPVSRAQLVAAFASLEGWDETGVALGHEIPGLDSQL